MVHQSQFIEETQRWENEGTIRDLIYYTVEKARKKYSADSKIRYIDISSVDNGTNTVTGVTEYIFKDAPSRAQQCVRKGDILVSTVRPNLKNMAVNHLDGEDLVASSGFCVLRPKEGCAGLIMAYLLSDVFTEKMTLVAKGTNYPAIHDSDILDYKIRLSQDGKESMIDKLFRQADKSKFDGFKSQFIELFGTHTHSRYPVFKLGDICSVKRGGSPRPISEYITDSPEGYNWIKIGDADESMYISKTEEKIKPSGLNKTRQVYAGDLLLSNSMSFGRPYILKIDGCIHDGWLVLHFDKSQIDPVYLCSYLSQESTYKELTKLASGGVVSNLNSEVVKLLPTILPPLHNQRLFVAIIDKADKSKYLN